LIFQVRSFWCIFCCWFLVFYIKSRIQENIVNGLFNFNLIIFYYNKLSNRIGHKLL
jgi:hypothetical protein